MKKIESIGELRIKIQKHHIETKLAIRELLSSEQRLKFDQKVLKESGQISEHCGMGDHKRNHKMMKIRKPALPVEIDEKDVDVEIEEIAE